MQPKENTGETQVMQTQQLRSITWEAPEHHHIEKNPEWFAILGIIALAASAAAFMVGNILFSVLIILMAIATALTSLRTPQTIPFAITARGVRVDDRLYPYTTLESYYIDEGPQLLIKGERLIMPLIVIPLPEEEVDEIEDLIAMKLPEEHLEEPFFAKVLEHFGF